MKKFEVRIPRLVRMTEWETMIVEAEDKDQALQNALARECVGESNYDQEDWEVVEEYDDEIEINEIKEVVC
tara:strand:- start:582 stop:794 length:213 start_codon:yes stop_codon:yes gene_type:complete